MNTKVWTRNDEKLQRALAPFIFNEQKILKTVSFSQFVTPDDEFAYGLILPKEEIGSDGVERQIWSPCIITSNRAFREVRRGECRELKIRFESIPAELPKRYSLVMVPQWLHDGELREGGRPTIKELVEEIKSVYEDRLFFSAKGWYLVHALWDVGTYFFSLFPAYPYIELRGVAASGKTKLMSISRLFSFNPSSILSSPSESSLFRLVHDQRPTLYIDEAENLFRIVKGRMEHDGRIEVINSGYNQEGKVSRSEPRGKQWVPVVYSTYCPKMLAGINGLYGATESRALVHIMTRAPDNDSRGECEVDSYNEEWQKIRDRLFIAALLHWRTIKETYEKISSEKIGLKKREFQLWRPIMALASLVGEDAEKAVLDVAKRQQAMGRGEELGRESWEYLLLERIRDLLKSGQQMVLYKDLRDAIPEGPSSKTISTILKRLGFGSEFWEHSREGNGLRFSSSQEFEAIAITIAPSLFSSSSSPASQNNEFEEIRITDVKQSEEKADSVNKNVDTCEDGDSREAVLGMKDEQIIKIIRLWKAQKNDFMPVEMLEKYPIENFDAWLAHKLKSGELYQPRPGVVGVLE